MPPVPCRKCPLSATSDHCEFWRNTPTDADVVAHSLITINANHPKKPADRTNSDHGKEGERTTNGDADSKKKHGGQQRNPTESGSPGQVERDWNDDYRRNNKPQGLAANYSSDGEGN